MRFLGLYCADFYADIWDLPQILRRYLDQKSAADSSAPHMGPEDISRASLTVRILRYEIEKGLRAV